MRDWFADHGIDIDDYTIELDRATHEAIHGGGDWKLAREKCDGEWNREMKKRITRFEHELRRTEGRDMTKDEILSIAQTMLEQRNLPSEFVRYPKAGSAPDSVVDDALLPSAKADTSAPR
jgi:hypothetical protein